MVSSWFWYSICREKKILPVIPIIPSLLDVVTLVLQPCVNPTQGNLKTLSPVGQTVLSRPKQFRARVRKFRAARSFTQEFHLTHVCVSPFRRRRHGESFVISFVDRCILVSRLPVLSPACRPTVYTCTVSGPLISLAIYTQLLCKHDFPRLDFFIDLFLGVDFDHEISQFSLLLGHVLNSPLCILTMIYGLL